MHLELTWNCLEMDTVHQWRPSIRTILVCEERYEPLVLALVQKQELLFQNCSRFLAQRVASLSHLLSEFFCIPSWREANADLSEIKSPLVSSRIRLEETKKRKLRKFMISRVICWNFNQAATSCQAWPQFHEYAYVTSSHPQWIRGLVGWLLVDSCLVVSSLFAFLALSTWLFEMQMDFESCGNIWGQILITVPNTVNL